MSATWSLTYLETTMEERALLDIVVEIFKRELEGKLYGLEWVERELVPVKLNEPIVERFTDKNRARMIAGSHYEGYSTGVLAYPPQKGLHVLVDTVIASTDVISSGRMRREELKYHLQEKPAPDMEAVFHYMHFLDEVTATMLCQAAHIMFSRNPAGRCTSVHLYATGRIVEDYYYENIEAMGSQLIELPKNPERLGQLLGGRFEFLRRQPMMRRLLDDVFVAYFDGEDLSPTRSTRWEIFGLEDSDLFVPFWEENMLPVGAVYCLKEPLPDYFLKRYDNPANPKT